MVDEKSRSRLACLLRRFTNGELSVAEYEVAATELWNSGLSAGTITEDKVIREALGHADTLAMELGNPHLVGRLALSKDYMDFYNRVILFLESNLEYRCADPTQSPDRQALLVELARPPNRHRVFHILRRLWFPRHRWHKIKQEIRSIIARQNLQRESGIWPFQSRDEIESELKRRTETKI